MASPAVRIPFQLITILFLMGSALLLFFILLAGIKSDGNVLNKWYWLAADTSNITNAPYPVSRWSMYGLCGYEQGSDVKHPGSFINCTSNTADYPFDLSRNFNIDKSDLSFSFQTNKFFYMTRFQFPFYLIAIFFDVVALFASLVGGNFRAAGFVTSASTFLTFIFSTIAAALSTAAYVQARNALQDENIDAAITPTLYGFAWAVVFMSFVNTIFACIITPSKNDSVGKYSAKKSGKKGGFKFGIKKKKTTEGPVDDKETSSFVRA